MPFCAGSAARTEPAWSWSAIGRGKTGAAIGLLRYYHSCGHSVAVHNVQELLEKIKDDLTPRAPLITRRPLPEPVQ